MTLHRKEYEDAKLNVLQLIETVLEPLQKLDPSVAGLEPKNCLFRINRDVRFSKDKSPYKTNIAAYINPGGKKTMTAGYYFHLEPGSSFVGGGLYHPPASILQKIRQEIDYNREDLLKAISMKSFRSVYGNMDVSEASLMRRMPKGYASDHPASTYLRLKSFVAIRPLTRQELLSSSLSKEILRSFTALQPLVSFLNQALDDPE